MSKHHIVIVGGGFGGVKTALELARDHRFVVTLISDHADFRYYPTLFRTATGGKRTISSIPLSEIFAGKPTHLLIDTVTQLDRAKRSVTTKKGRVIHFDGLVLSLGVKTNYFHIKGLEEYSFGIKSLHDAETLKLHLHKQMIDERRPDLNYVVVGGGPTGVELAGALPGYIEKISRQHGITKHSYHVDLVEAAPRVLPRSPKHISRRVAKRLRSLGVKLYLGTAVEAETADALMIKGRPIRSHTVIWTAGITNHPFFAQHEFQLSRGGKVRVDQFLQAEPAMYVIGDNADTPYSGLAQTALYDGKFVARNLRRLADGKDPAPYTAKKPAYVFPVGPHWAAVVWGPVLAYGRLGWLLRRAADWVGYHDYEPWQMASQRWLAEDDSEEACPGCAK